jgi:tetratricopeptide (TPR) repeat protein
VEKLPLFVLALAVGVITMASRSTRGSVVSLSEVPLRARLANAAGAYGWYLFHTFWPTDLAILYPHRGRDWSVPAALVGGGTLFTLSALALCQAIRRRWLFAGWLWFVGVLVPVIGLAQGGLQAWADRFSYWAHIGLFVALAWGLGELADRSRLPWRVSGALGALILGWLGVLTWGQIGFWRDTPTLWTRTLAVTVDNHAAHVHLGRYYHIHGQLAQAEIHLSEAVRLLPSSPEYRSYLAALLLALGKLEEAAEQACSAVKVDSHWADAWYQLARTSLRQGKAAIAARHFRKVLELHPTSPEALAGLGQALWRAGKRQEAVGAFQAALERDPQGPDAWHGLGLAYLVEGKLDQAIDALWNALQFRPQMVSAASELGLALGRRGRWYHAIGCHVRAVQLHEQQEAFLAQMNGRVPALDWSSPAVIYNCRLAFALYQYGDHRPADVIYQEARKRDPRWPEKCLAKAWQLATSADENVRDPPLAYEMANQVIQASHEPSATMLDTLAASLAALGRFPEAVQTVQQALQQLPVGREARLAQDIRDHLRLYQQNKSVITQPQTSPD